MIQEIRDINIINEKLSNFNTSVKEIGVYTKYYGYVDNDSIVGFLSFDFIYDRAEINYIFVEEKYRKKGIATKLLNHMLDICNNECKNITLEVKESNKSAIKFYLKNGFIEVARREKYYQDEDGILMIKEMK